MLFKNQLVDFLICGTQKGGTTAVDSYLRNHPRICMAKEKEVHFFDNEEYFKHSHMSYSEYHAAFAPQEPCQIIGETTPIYMYWQKAHERIFQYNPQIKIILLLRNPIERAYSQWNMEYKRGNENLCFMDAINAEKTTYHKFPLHQDRVRSYVGRGFYTKQINEIRRYFPEKQVLILSHNQLKTDPKGLLRSIYKFIKVDEYFSFDFTQKIHATPYETHISPLERKYLLNIFENEIYNLEQSLGWDCSEWLS